MATLTKPATIQAYSYSRFSSSGQRGSISIPRQIERARAYAKQEGWTLDESLRDEKTSAFKGKHRLTGDLAKFLKLIQTGKIQPGSFLIVEAMDRLSREKVSVALSMFLQIITAGVGIVTLVDNRRYTVDNIDRNPYELMGSIALMAAANEYSSKLSDRVKDAYQRDFKAAKSGKGRILAGSIPYWIQLDGGKLVFHPERAQVMRKIVGWAMTGWGVEKIAKALTAERIPTATRL